MKNSIKRAQSQARLSFAERENFRPKVRQLKKTLLTLVALLAVTTGAWATTVTWVTNDFYGTGSAAFTKYDVTVTPSNNDARHSDFFYNKGVNTFTTTLGNFTKIEIVFMPESSPLSVSGWDYELIEAVQPDPQEMPDVWEYTSKLTWTGDAESVSIQGAVNFIKSITFTIAEPPSGPEVAWDKAKKAGTFTMPGGNVTLEPEYYPQAALTAAPTAINDVPATTDGAIVKAGTVANIGSTETAQGTVMYYVSPTALDDAALLALAADQWTADVPTAESLAQGQAYVYYYVRGNDSNKDEENFSDGDILSANALTVTIAAEPTYAVTFAEGVNPEPPAEPEWTASPNADVKKGQTVTVTYTGSKKVIGVKAEKKAAPASTPLDNTTTAWTAGSYAVPAGGLTYGNAITVSGDVTLTLTDGETLTLNKGISLAEGATLTVEGNGTMNINGTNNSTASTVAGTGTLVLTSGTLNAKGGNGQGVGDESMDTDNRANAGGNAINGNVTVSGGTLTATGGNGGGVGMMSGGSYGAAGGVAISGNVTITDGTVTATGGNGGSIGAMGMDEYGGNGGAAIGGDATISGGTWTATDGTHGVNGNGQGGAGGKAVAGTITDNR